MENFRKYSITFEGMKLILGGTVGSAGMSSSGVESISCRITLDGGVSAGGECAYESVDECYTKAGKMCASYVKNYGGSCIIGHCG